MTSPGGMNFEPIGVIRSCYREKFATPRQSGLAADAEAVLEFPSTPRYRDALRGLEGFSHVWVIFAFHRIPARADWKALVRPPRLGGARKMGVFATRAPHRPNPIGISAVRLEKIVIPRARGSRAPIELHLRGGDFVDGTPVLDIKPYIPYADRIPSARAAWARDEIRRLPVRFSPAARSAIRGIAAQGYPNLTRLIRQTVSLDPRPAFQKKEATGSYAAQISDFDVAWEVARGRCVVTRISALPGSR